MTVISLLIALGAGIISFASPCCLPLVPVYLSYMAGADASATRQARLAALRQSVAFVIGFSAVFVTMWASIGVIGYALRDYAGVLRVVGGVALIVMGLHVAGLIEISALYRDVRLPMSRLLGSPTAPAAARVPTGAGVTSTVDGVGGDTAATTASAGPAGPGPSYGRSTLLGVAFAAGWTPCIGPILGGIIGLASQSDSVVAGTGQLIAYSLGLGIPFMLVAVGATEVRGRFNWFRRHDTAISVVTGAMIGLVGFLMITNMFARLSGLLPSVGI